MKNISIYTTTVAKAQTITELISYNGYEFIHCAYLSILDRDPDPMGIDYYLKRLCKGIPKLQIIEQIAKSAEASQKNQAIKNIKIFIELQAYTRIPFIGKIVELLFSLEQTSKNSSRLRGIEQTIHIQTKHLNFQIENLNIAVTASQRAITNQLRTIEKSLEKSKLCTTTHTSNANSGVHSQIAHSDITLEIYEKIQAAISNNLVQEGN